VGDLRRERGQSRLRPIRREKKWQVIQDSQDIRPNPGGGGEGCSERIHGGGKKKEEGGTVSRKKTTPIVH